MRNNTNNHGKLRELSGVIAGLVGQLQELAPHPSRPNYRGPLFLQNHSACKPASEHDGMLGSMIIESMIGGAFAQAASDAFGESVGEICNDFDATSALECYSEYITDIENKRQEIAAHGQGSLARLSGKSISGAFNLRGSISSGMQAFLDDLPKRMKIEQTLGYYCAQLDLVHMAPVHEPMHAPSLAA